MKKKMIRRGLLGFPIGMAYGEAISIAVLWLALYLIVRYNVKKMNETLDRRRAGGGTD